MNGKPGDHPITDIVVVGIRVIGAARQSDSSAWRSLRNIIACVIGLSSIGRRHRSSHIVAAKLAEMRRVALEGGWENVP